MFIHAHCGSEVYARVETVSFRHLEGIRPGRTECGDEVNEEENYTQIEIYCPRCVMTIPPHKVDNAVLTVTDNENSNESA